MEDKDKKIDETWKNQVDKEKETTDNQGQQNEPEADFNFFITTLAMQASIALGEAPNPMTNKKEENLIQAKFIIDVLAILKDKTSGNLNTEEDKLLEELLYGLRMSYVDFVKRGEKK